MDRKAPSNEEMCRALEAEWAALLRLHKCEGSLALRRGPMGRPLGYEWHATNHPDGWVYISFPQLHFVVETMWLFDADDVGEWKLPYVLQRASLLHNRCMAVVKGKMGTFEAPADLGRQWDAGHHLSSFTALGAGENTAIRDLLALRERCPGPACLIAAAMLLGEQGMAEDPKRLLKLEVE